MGHEPDLSLRQETFSPRARNRSGSDVRVTSRQDLLRGRPFRGFHVDNGDVTTFKEHVPNCIIITYITRRIYDLNYNLE